MLLAPELTCKVPLIFDNSSTSIIPTLGRLNTPYLETQTTQRLKCFQNFFSQKLSYKWVTESDDDNDDFAGGLLHWMVILHWMAPLGSHPSLPNTLHILLLLLFMLSLMVVILMMILIWYHHDCWWCWPWCCKEDKGIEVSQFFDNPIILKLFFEPKKLLFGNCLQFMNIVKLEISIVVNFLFFPSYSWDRLSNPFVPTGQIQ